MTVLLCILACFVPPAAVFLAQRKCDVQVPLNILLWILGWVPGVVHAFYVILRKEPAIMAATL